jgi:hypothetical protein
MKPWEIDKNNKHVTRSKKHEHENGENEYCRLIAYIADPADRRDYVTSQRFQFLLLFCFYCG